MSDKPEALRLADELTASVGTQSTYSAMQQAADELRRLHAVEAERDAAVADAERYRWLRENKFKHNGHCFALKGPILWEETLDAAIDAAKEEK